MGGYCFLNVHSNFSLLEGLPTPAQLVEAAARQGMPALALTDHWMLSGSVEFYRACLKQGVQPILGLEVDLSWPDGTQRLALLASGLTGWANLCRISSELHQGSNAGHLQGVEWLEPHNLDLVAVCGAGPDSGDRRIGQIAEIFNGRTYVGLENPDGGGVYKMRRQVGLAQKLNLPVTVFHPVYSLRPDQAALQRLATAIRLNGRMNDLKSEDCAPSGSYFLNSAEVIARYGEFPEALAATLEISQRCQVELPVGKANMPQVDLPAGMNIQQYLRQKAEAGARKIYKRITPEIRARLDHELEVIAERGFEPIFLIVEDIIVHAREMGVPTSSRGSAASSLVAHCLAITSPDPLALNLYFERFLNPARKTPPDIDTDICSRGRDRVIQYVFDRYGVSRVAMVGTVNRFRPRSALSDAAKAHGWVPERIRELSNMLPYAFFSRREVEEGETESISPFAELRRSHPQHKALLDEAEALLSLPRHLSVHPGGLIIAPALLTDLVPVMRSGSKSIPITQMDLESVEALGLVKIDLLGIRGLTVMGDVAQSIYSWRRKEFKTALDVLDAIPVDDSPTADRVEKGETIGCFQIESPGMRSVLREIRARKPDDILAALALYRPGPLSGGLKDAFVRRFKGEEAVQHIHPAVEPLLAETYGVILYQEQVLRIANQLAGFTLAEADLLRRAMSHFDPGKQMILLQEKFINSAEERSGVPRETGQRIWEMMAAFAGYGFPKAHAASYAQISWRSAWCKTHFPAEFMAAVLANWGGYYSQRVYLTEARRMGLKVKPPHVNHSQMQFTVTYPDGEQMLFMGLDQIRDLTHRTQMRILVNRPFSSLEDFLSRVDPRSQEAENLAKVGAMEGWGTIPALLRRIQQGGWKPGQMSLFDWETSQEGQWSLEQRVAAQMDLLGTSLDAHPLELVAAKIAAAGAITTLEASERVGQRVTVAGVRQSSHRSRTEKGELMMFLTLEDLDGLIDLIIFPDVYYRVKNWINTSKPLLVTGMVEMDPSRGEALLRVERIVMAQPV